MINSKNYVTHQDIKDLLPYVLKHRIKFLKQEEKNDFVISEILNKINIKK
jgi:MoxR-like ATPase